MTLKVKKKKSKIVRRKSGTKSNMYFNENTAKAIDQYRLTNDQEVRAKLYMTEIYPAFSKLVENLIFIHGFKGLHDSYDDLKNDCVTFLYEAICKFDPTRGFKPFSYFNVVAKHWLIIRSKQRVSKLRKNLSIDDESLSRGDREAIELAHILPAQDEQLESIEFVLKVHHLLDKIKERVTSENEIKCIDAVIKIFKTVDDLNDGPYNDISLNKRAIFMYMREISGLNPKQLTTVVASIKKHYKDLKNDEIIGIY